MKVGELTVNIVSDGRFKQDGGALFGVIPKPLWEPKAKPDRRNRVTLGLNCLLIQSPQGTILVDTGIGTKESDTLKERYGLASSRLIRSLRAYGVAPRDVNLVVLTHLHFDHSGGNTKRDSSGRVVPTFPRAKYLMQRACWEDANAPNERHHDAFHPDDFVPLMERGLIQLLDGDAELVPHVWVRHTGGHARGHQIVTIEGGSERVAFLGDLVPTAHHVPLPYITAFDHSPDETLEQKRRFLDLIERNGWLIIFSHDDERRAGYLDRRNGNLLFRAVEL